MDEIDRLWRGECRRCRHTYDAADSELRLTYPEMAAEFDAGAVLCRCPDCNGVIDMHLTDSVVMDFDAWDYQVPPGFCPECGIAHPEAIPHDPTTMTYILGFRRKCIDVGAEPRWPTWRDAMRHCTDEVRQGWIVALAAKGVTDLDATTT